MKPLLVGETNPYGPNANYALYPDPPGCAGHRLCYRILGLNEREYFERFDRVNLCSGRWNFTEASRRAVAVSIGRRDVVLFGRKVWRAFGLKRDMAIPFSTVIYPDVNAEIRLLRAFLLPHPSGRNTEWNAPGAVERARSVLRSAGLLSDGTRVPS